METKTCDGCGAVFARAGRKNRDWGRMRFCTQVCATKSRAKDWRVSIEQRSLPDPETGCIEWQGYRDPRGYGRLGTTWTPETLTHRLSYIKEKGPIPPGMDVLHNCDNPPCLNPAHLYLGTDKENMRDRIARNRNARQVGEKNPNARLTAEQVQAIREDARNHKQVAADYGVSWFHVSVIRRGRCWKEGQ